MTDREVQVMVALLTEIKDNPRGTRGDIVSSLMKDGFTGDEIVAAFTQAVIRGFIEKVDDVPPPEKIH